MAEPHFLKHPLSLGGGLFPAVPGYQGRHHRIFKGIEFGQQVMKLEHKPYMAVSESGKSAFLQFINVPASEENLTLAGRVQAPHKVQQCGLADAAYPGDCNALTQIHREVHPFQNLDNVAVVGIGLADLRKSHDLTRAVALDFRAHPYLIASAGFSFDARQEG